MNQIVDMTAIKDVVGSKGKAGAGGGVEAPNTLRSDNRAKMLFLIGEGPCEGPLTPTNEGQSIYLDYTPVVNANGTPNFRGVQWAWRTGLPDQPDFPANPQVETPFTVGTDLSFNIGPIVKTIEDANATSVRVIVTVPALAASDKDGNINPTSVGWKVEVAPLDGAYVVTNIVNLANQKCTSPFDSACIAPLPTGGHPWRLRVTRTTADTTDIKIQNKTTFTSYTEIVAGRFTYPNSALLYLNVDADLYGSGSLPTVRVGWGGRKISVPTNYDAFTRAYTGFWDGTFKQAMTDNPAWIYYDLVINDRFGLGDFVDASKIDKWSLYQIAHYCDQLIDNGFGGIEPRYTFNGTINQRKEAFKLLQEITSSFRGMAYWSIGQVFATADMPKDAVKLVSPANCIGGAIEYSGTALKANHSVAIVHWTDPVDFYRPALEIVIDNAQVERFGWREMEINLAGVCSRGLANRYGRWALDSEKSQTETATFSLSWDNFIAGGGQGLVPGDIVSIADPRKAEVRTGGRLISIDGGGVYTLDGPFEPADGETYSLICELSDGTIESQPAISIVGGVVQVSPDFSVAPQEGAMWVITGTDVRPRDYQVLSRRETAKNVFEITSLFYDPNKYERVENGIFLDVISYHRNKSTIEPVSNIAIHESLSFLNGQPVSTLTCSWTPGTDFLGLAYKVSANTPNGFVDYGKTKNLSIDIPNNVAGPWTFHVTTIGINGKLSQTVDSAVFNAQGYSAIDVPYVTNLEVVGGNGSLIWGGADLVVEWINVFSSRATQPDATTGSGVTNPFYHDNIVKVYNGLTNALMRTESVGVNSYVYTMAKNIADTGGNPVRTLRIDVAVQDNLNRTSPYTSIVVANNPPAAPATQLTATFGQVYINCAVSLDLDYAGNIIWLSKTTGFDPQTTSPLYVGPNNSWSTNLPPSRYFARVAQYDVFAAASGHLQQGLNIGPEIAVDATELRVTDTAPDVPTHLAVSQSAATQNDGTIIVTLKATWDVSPSASFGFFVVSFQQDSLDPVEYATTSPNYAVAPAHVGSIYTIKARAVSKLGNSSDFCSPLTIRAVAKATPPGDVSGVTADPALQNCFLSWTLPPDTDIDHCDVFMGKLADASDRALIGSSHGDMLTISSLNTDETYYFWVKAVNTSGLSSVNYSAPASAKMRKLNGVEITDNSVSAEKIIAGSITADRIRANSITGDLIQTSTALPGTITVGNTGVKIGSLTDPAGLINAGTTQIDPGKIIIAGSTTLANWRNGADITKIEGGNIATNTIQANSLVIGARGVRVTGLKFTTDNLNTVNWADGVIFWTDSTNNARAVSITHGGLFVSSTDIAYIYWVEGAAVLSADNNEYTATHNATGVLLAVYSQALGLLVLSGGTQINGADIKTGSIEAAQIKAGSITADKINVGTISSLSANLGRITSGFMQSFDGRFIMDLDNRFILISDG
jgi:predicted phage tail protein